MTASTPTTPARRLRVVTKSDAGTNWTGQATEAFAVTKALYVGTQGNLVVIAEDDTDPVTLVGVIGEVNIRAKRVMAATTAADIVAYF